MIPIAKKKIVSRLFHRVTIQAQGNPTADGQGGFTENWEDSATVWAGINSMNVSQVNEYASINVHATHNVEMRGDVNIQEGHRVVYGSRVFEVLTVDNERERGARKWVVCKERRD